ncbi:MAG: endo-1,4-beta-xylanase [Chloroflexi bacterium]|nr:endo-1,4-beta-xylanase [Chloroflexota bacterium]
MIISDKSYRFGVGAHSLSRASRLWRRRGSSAPFIGRRVISATFLLALLLVACAPVAATETRLATSPTATPTLANTETPTPVPTIEVDGLHLPDPKITNPELFDLTNPDSPIVQFANAFGIAPEEVGELKPELKTAIDGSQFAVVTTSDLPSTADFDESGTPLLIAEQEGVGEWKWAEATLRNISDQLGIYSGTPLGGFGFAQYYNELIKIQKENFNYGMIGAGMWVFKGPNEFTFKDTDSDVRLGVNNKMHLLGHLLVWPSVVPDWMQQGNYSAQQIRDITINWITIEMQRYPQIKTWNVVNEAYNKDFYQQKLGDDYLIQFYEAARAARPDAILIYNDYANHSLEDKNWPNGQRTALTFQIIQKLQMKALIDGVGVQMVIFADKLPPSYEDITNALKSYGLPVYITEFQVIMTNVPGSQQERLLIQADIYKNIVKAILDSGVSETIVYFNQSDKVSPWELDPKLPEYSKNADPTLFDDNYQPKPAYFGVLQALINSASE